MTLQYTNCRRVVALFILIVMPTMLGGCFSNSLLHGSDTGGGMKYDIDSGRVTTRVEVEQRMGVPTDVSTQDDRTEAAYAFRYVPRSPKGTLNDSFFWMPMAIMACPPSGLAGVVELMATEPGRMVSEIRRHADDGRTHILHVCYNPRGTVIPDSAWIEQPRQTLPVPSIPPSPAP